MVPFGTVIEHYNFLWCHLQNIVIIHFFIMILNQYEILLHSKEQFSKISLRITNKVVQHHKGWDRRRPATSPKIWGKKAKEKIQQKRKRTETRYLKSDTFGNAKCDTNIKNTKKFERQIAPKY